MINSCISFAVTNFARAIGEIHSLSRADLHLIALAWSLHTSLHGEHSLHKEPAPARAIAKGKPGNRLMPGWGAAGGKWEEMDRLEEAEKAALEQAQGMLLTRLPTFQRSWMIINTFQFSLLDLSPDRNAMTRATKQWVRACHRKCNSCYTAFVAHERIIATSSVHEASSSANS